MKKRNVTVAKLLAGSAILTVGLMASSTAFAEPTLYPNQNIVSALSALKNNTNSNIVADTQDRNKVWVMPPNSGSASVSNLYMSNANLGFCPELATLQKSSLQLMSQLSGLNDDLKEQGQRIAAMRDELAQARKDAADYATEKNMKDLSDTDDRITQLESRLSLLYDQDNKCSGDCDQIEQEIRDTENAKRAALNLRTKLAAEHAQDMGEYMKRRAKVDAIKQNIQDANLDQIRLDERISAAQKLILDNYSTFGQMEGGRANINYDSGWDTNVNKLRAENPGVAFQKIETRNAEIMTSMQVKGLAGSAIMAVESAGNTNGGNVINYSSYPGNFSADVVLSLLGACPILHPADFGLDPSVTKVQGIKFGLTASYEYPTVVNYSVDVTYNMHSFYQKIVDSGTSGGFFSSHSYTDITETSWFKDSLPIVWHDPENQVPPEEKKKIEEELRMDVLARLVGDILPESSPLQLDQYAKLAPPPQHGALVISNSLMQVCPGNGYCVAGSIVLNALDAIFGSSSSTASYTKIVDKTFTDSISNNQKVYKPWVTTYQP